MQALPQNLDAERSVIGAVLNNNDLLCDVIDIISPDDFYNTGHKELYKSMFDMYNKNIPVDIVTLVNYIGKDKIEAFGGITYLSNLIASVPMACNVRDYAKIIKEKSDKRTIIKSCSDALQKAYDEKIEPKEVVNLIEDELLNVGCNSESRILSDDELMEKTLNMIQKNYSKGGNITGITTGYESLDYAINGLTKGDFVVIAGRPSMGKTCFALNITNNIPENKNAALFELEMSAEKLGARRLASRCFINATRLPRGKLDPQEWEKVVNGSTYISSKNNIFTDTNTGQTVQEIKAKCKKIKLKYGLDIAIIDHIGLITPTNIKENRVNQVTEITRNLKNMAKELDMTVIALSQLSRAPEQRTDHRPILADLRESGSIEQDADLIMFLYRDEYYNKNSEDKGTIEVIIAKQRDGRTGTIKLAYKPEYQLISEFEDMTCVGTFDPAMFNKQEKMSL